MPIYMPKITFTPWYDFQSSTKAFWASFFLKKKKNFRFLFQTPAHPPRKFVSGLSFTCFVSLPGHHSQMRCSGCEQYTTTVEHQDHKRHYAWIKKALVAQRLLRKELKRTSKKPRTKVRCHKTSKFLVRFKVWTSLDWSCDHSSP